MHESTNAHAHTRAQAQTNAHTQTRKQEKTTKKQKLSDYKKKRRPRNETNGSQREINALATENHFIEKHAREQR